jgi:hypothetical protein
MGVTQSLLTATLKVTEDIDAGNEFATVSNGEDSIVHYKTLSETQTPGGAVPVTKVVATEVALIAGAKTLDFTAIAGTNGRTHDMSALRLQHLILKNKTGNAAMTFEVGASNGYTGLGSAFSVTLAAKQAIIFIGQEGAAEVAAGVKTIDITGTGTEIFEIIAVFG